MEVKTRVAAIIVKAGKLLMVKGKGYKELWTPGGKIEQGETEEECLRRELREEIGVEVTNLKFFNEYSAKSLYHEWIIKQKVYIVSIKGKIVPGAEIEDFMWLSKKDFKNRKYAMIPVTEKKIIPDLIKNKIF